jgi:hypothetical protein
MRISTEQIAGIEFESSWRNATFSHVEFMEGKLLKPDQIVERGQALTIGGKNRGVSHGVVQAPGSGK